MISLILKQKSTFYEVTWVLKAPIFLYEYLSCEHWDSKVKWDESYLSWLMSKYSILWKSNYLKYLSYPELSLRAKSHIIKDFSAAEIRFINTTLCLFLFPKLS